MHVAVAGAVAEVGPLGETLLLLRPVEEVVALVGA